MYMLTTAQDDYVMTCLIAVKVVLLAPRHAILCSCFSLPVRVTSGGVRVALREDQAAAYDAGDTVEVHHYLMGSNYREGFVSCTDARSICATEH